MTFARPVGFLRESPLSRHAVRLSVLVMLGTLAYLVWRYPRLPDLLPVHFRRGRPDGWQYKTVARVLLPFFVQVGIFGSSAATAVLLLSRKDASTASSEPDASAAVTAAEAVVLMAATWVAFQAYAAYALLTMWTTYGRVSLGRGYTMAEVAGVVLTIAIGVRAQRRLSGPTPLPFVAAHWRLGQLYCNREHPALFVPTRDGRKWTLNFGRPAAVALLGGILAVGIAAPTAMLVLALR